jgi:hypothetical protein
VVDACAKARDKKSCDPGLIGQDDRVPRGSSSNSERRLARYGWLRALLVKAQTRDEAADKTEMETGRQAAEKSTRPSKPVTSQLLQAAEARLAADTAQAAAAAPALPAHHDNERAVMKQILTERGFRGLEARTARDSALEMLSAWLNRLFQHAAKFQAVVAWAGRLIVYGFILAVCAGLALGLLQLERRGRIRLTPESGSRAAEAVSARIWQLWFKDARRAAADGLWREAIHFVYWAAISGLESKRLWPADRARTPREYLALVAAEDTRKPQLAALTSGFERVWYGGCAAAESDYRKAEELANALISGRNGAIGGGGR